MKESKNKGLLVVSFGTTHMDTCRETIGAIEDHLAKAMPGRRFYRAWTSSFIIRKLKERDGVEIDTVSEALERMVSDGIEDVLVVPTHMLPGAEYDKMMATLAEGCRSDMAGYRFEKFAVSRPLLDSDEDLKQLAAVIAGELLSPSDPSPAAGHSREADPLPAADRSRVFDSEAVVLMGHGSADRPEVNEIYVRLEEEFRRAGHDNVFVGTVEGSPSIDEVIERLNDWSTRAGDQADARSSSVAIAPLMIVAGDHAINDMAGDSPDSWKNRIEGIDMEAIPIIRGLGSYAGVQKMFLDHAKRAAEPMGIV